MIRPGTLLWLVIVGLVGFGMFKVKYEVMQLEDELTRTNRAIVTNGDAIHVLKAEWSFLSQPSRLDELSRRYLELAPIGTAQLGRLDAVPLRPSANPLVAAITPPPTTIPMPTTKPPTATTTAANTKSRAE